MKLRFYSPLPILAASLIAALGGCASSDTTISAGSREHFELAGDSLRFGDGAHGKVPPPAGSNLGDYIRFAVVNHPRVAAAYQDWRAAIADIAPARALPDPKLTFEADIADTLMTLMPGIMFDFMSSGKREAMAAERTAASEVARRAFIEEVLAVAASVQREWIELAYSAESTRLHHAAVGALEQMNSIADADYATGGMMTSLATQIDIQERTAEHLAQHESSGDRLAAARTRFKSALGLLPGDADPAWPDAALEATPVPDYDTLWQRVLESNPELARMRAMVEMSVANVQVARKAGTPDFSLGLMSDLKASPVMFRPTASLSLPIWREKIADTIAGAGARSQGAEARVDAMQLELAAELARMLYMVRESDRMLAYIDGTALPSLARMAELAGAGYQSGAGGAAMIADTSLRTQLVGLNRLEVLRQREDAVTGLLLMTAGIAPAEIAALTGPAQAQP